MMQKIRIYTTAIERFCDSFVFLCTNSTAGRRMYAITKDRISGIMKERIRNIANKERIRRITTTIRFVLDRHCGDIVLRRSLLDFDSGISAFVSSSCIGSTVKGSSESEAIIT